jgi:uncharacterized protein (DUF1800 family)
MPNASQRLIATVLVAALTTPILPAESSVKPAPMPEAKRAIHALNRLTFGPRPGDVEMVRAIGVDKWIELQLNPEKINDSALEARLAPLRTLKMDSREIVENYPPPPVLKAVAEGRVPMPSDPKKRAVYESGIAAYRAREKAKAEGKDDQAPPPDGPDEMMAADDKNPEKQAMRREARTKVRELAALEPDARFNAILKMDPEARMALGGGLGPEMRERLAEGMTDDQKQTLLAMARPQAIVQGELAEAKLLRAAYSERQLEEVMTDFWFNHFNVFVGKGADRYLLTEYERDVIRKHAFGKFKDLLLATAESPAMLFYLDNWQSIGPNSLAGRFGGRRGQRGTFRRSRAQRGQMMPLDLPDPQPQVKRGLNENYARELMELHTLGVDGGYTQQDIIEVAKVFSGWTIKQPRRGGGFEFDERRHEPGTKVVLGTKINEGGMGEGKMVVALLAKHPATAKFISKKLAMRFVSDVPPASLVDRMAATFTKTDGDIKEVLRTLFKSPEFWSQDAYRAKVKTPLEFVVSAVRATNTDVKQALPLARALNEMGMPLYGAQPPTGYSMKAETWVNSAALLNRMNFALALGGGKLRGVESSIANTMPKDTQAAFAKLSGSLLAGDLSEATKQTIQKQMEQQTEQNPGATAGLIVGLIMGSPEFQRR